MIRLKLKENRTKALDPYLELMSVSNSIFDKMINTKNVNLAKKYKKLKGVLTYNKKLNSIASKYTSDYGSYDYTKGETEYTIKYCNVKGKEKQFKLNQAKFNAFCDTMQAKGHKLQYRSDLICGHYEAGGLWLETLTCYTDDHDYLWHCVTKSYYDI